MAPIAVNDVILDGTLAYFDENDEMKQIGPLPSFAILPKPPLSSAISPEPPLSSAISLENTAGNHHIHFKWVNPWYLKKADLDLCGCSLYFQDL
ncbi:hypothetical protein Tco_1352379 [Tanacetum coccineum]